MNPISAGENSRTMFVYTTNNEHRLQASAFGSDYTCGYRVKFNPTPLPTDTVCEVDGQGRMSFSLPASAFSEPIVDVILESTFYNGMSVVTDDAGPFATCQ